MFRRIRPEFKYFQKRGRNPMWERIRSENQCLQKKGQYSSVTKNEVRIPMLGRNSNV